MNKKELFKFYEKLYFHEIENRDKITSRLQLPLAIFISFFSIVGLMVKNINYELTFQFLVIFFLFLAISVIPVSVAIYYFIKAFFGHAYEFLPTASKTEEYNNELHKTYEEYESEEELVNKYLSEYLYKDYHECSSTNSKINDKRSEFIHRSNFFIILSIIPIFITFLIFTFAKIDKNIQEISINDPLSISPSSNPIEIRIVDNELLYDIHKSLENLTQEVKFMAKEKSEVKTPPPPPPPPPKRVIREDVQIGKKKVITIQEVKK